MHKETVRWGVLATGGIASSFTTDLLAMRESDGAEVVAVASRTTAGAKAFAERFGIPRAYGGWAELAADEDVDVVYVAGPHSAHRAAAALCLEAGRNVLCEKAFTLNSRQARKLVAVARRHDSRHSLRYEAAEVMRCLRAGEKESPLVPLEGSLAVTRTLDAVRDRIGVRCPADEEE
ncbi:hypothetical protein GCM10009730_52920 [Streptomyces albidochromogenes]|nr:Gfo/Idh/MocA family oxidoreductase [Streptomyces albidochromogenes]